MLPPRTTSDNVASIIEVDTEIGLDPFMDVANELVTEYCTGKGQGYSTQRLENIERWLSAHFYAIRDQRPAMEAVGPVRVGYQKVIGTAFDATQFGQQAMLLDTKGGLAALNNKQKLMRDLTIGITYLGKPSQDQLNQYPAL